MSGAIAQFATGDHGRLLDLTLRWHREYAARHGLGYFVERTTRLPGVPDAWSKLPMVLALLREGHSPVVWLDADVVVADPTRNVADSCDGGLGMTHYPRPFPHFNSGVLVAWNEPAVVGVLERASRFAGVEPTGLPGSGFWEQPYLNSLGRGVIRPIGPEWNHREGMTACDRPALVGAHGMPLVHRVGILLSHLPEGFRRGDT